MQALGQTHSWASSRLPKPLSTEWWVGVRNSPKSDITAPATLAAGGGGVPVLKEAEDFLVGFFLASF